MGYMIPSDASQWTPAQLAEVLAQIHYSVACREDGLSHGDGPVYLATEMAAWAAAKTAYAADVEAYGPELLPRAREIRLDCGESIAYCIRRAKEYIDEDAAQARGDREREAIWRYAVAAVSQGAEGESYWLRHLVRFFPEVINDLTARADSTSERLARLARSSAENLIFDILSGVRACPCGNDHAGDKRIALNWGSPETAMVLVPAPRTGEPVVRCGHRLMPYMGARPAELVCGEVAPCWRHPSTDDAR